MSHRALLRSAQEADVITALGSVGTVLARAAETDGTFEVLTAQLPQGFMLPPHRHAWAEFYAVVDGTLDVTIGRRTVTIEPGGIGYVPPNAVHTLATPARGCRTLLWTSGEGLIAMLEDFEANLPAGLPDEALVPQIFEVASHHGVEMLAPVA